MRQEVLNVLSLIARVFCHLVHCFERDIALPQERAFDCELSEIVYYFAEGWAAKLHNSHEHAG